MSGRIAWLTLGLALSVMFVSQSEAASLLEKNFWLSGPRYDRVMPACDSPPALDRSIGMSGGRIDGGPLPVTAVFEYSYRCNH